MDVQERIKEMVTTHKVFLFMKGTPEMPQCGFSAHVVDILKHYKITFESFDVLSDETIRQGVKEYGDWPTLPQLYVDGKLIGGCDIVTQMARSGELQKLVKV